MAKYKIEISYQTGNSFNSEDTTDVIELEWDNLEIVKENLQAIKDHYEMQSNCTGYRSNKEKEYSKNRKKFWFVSELKPYSKKTKCSHTIEEYKKNPDLYELKADDHYAQNCIKLKADNGNLMQMNCFWCGYFETLYGAEVLSDESDMKFTL